MLKLLSGAEECHC